MSRGCRLQAEGCVRRPVPSNVEGRLKREVTLSYYRSGIADGARKLMPLRLLLMANRLSGFTPSGRT